MLVFRRHEARLRDAELDALHQWVHEWLSGDVPRRVVAGCCPDTGRHARRRRWEQLCEDLARFGVPRAWIEGTDEWSEPAWSSPATPLPEDVVWLQVSDEANAATARRPISDAVTRNAHR